MEESDIEATDCLTCETKFRNAIKNLTEVSAFFMEVWPIINFFNPYRQILGTISKERVVIQGISRKLFPGFVKILQFLGMTQGISGNYFQVNSMSIYTWKNILSQKRVMTQRLWKNFWKFSWVIIQIYEVINIV